MPIALRVVRGKARMAEIPGLDTSLIYDESFTVPSGGLVSGDIITLPNSGSYTDKDLEVFFNGQFLEEDVDYEYVGTAPRTQVKVLRSFNEAEKIRFRSEFDAAEIYDETVVVGVGGISAGSNITLPDLETYKDAELAVYLGGYLLEEGQDYNYVGLDPRTQIQITVDLFENERLRFRKSS